MNSDDDVLNDIAPQGVLRVAINYGNPVLAQKDPESGQPRGVSSALATELARRLGLNIEFKAFEAAGRVTDALSAGAWDIAFLARDPVRAESITFTAPYVVIEGTYLVRDDAPFQHVEGLDRDGVRIAVGRGAAYDLFLSRALSKATVMRAATSAQAVDLFVDEQLDAAAGVRQPLAAYASAHDGFKVLPGRFTAIEQAVCVPRGREAASRYLSDFVQEMIASGFVRAALERSGQHDVTVPAARE